MTSPQANADAELPAVRSRRWVAAMLSLVVFLAGGLVGAGLTYLYLQDRLNLRGVDRMVDELRRELGLSSAQTEQVRSILTQRGEAQAELRRAVRPQLEQQMQIVHDQIAQVLTPDQLPKWEAKFDQLRKRVLPPLPPTQAVTAPSAGAP